MLFEILVAVPGVVRMENHRYLYTDISYNSINVVG